MTAALAIGGGWRYPHVWHFLEGSKGGMPQGWMVCRVRAQHAHTGGSTTTIWWVVHWVPQGAFSHPASRVPVQPWIPLFVRVDSIVCATPYPWPVHGVASVPSLILISGDPGILLTDG